MANMFDAGGAQRLPLPLRAAAVDALFTCLAPMFLGFVPSLAIVGLITWTSGDALLAGLAFAFAASLLWCSVECGLYHLARRRMGASRSWSERDLRRWEARYGVPAVLYALLIGAWGVQVMTLGNIHASALATLVAAANLAGAVSRNASSSWIVPAQVCAMLAPLCLLLVDAPLLYLTLMTMALPSILCFRWLADRQRNILFNAVIARTEAETALAQARDDAARLKAALKAKASAEHMIRVDRLTGLLDGSQLDPLSRAACEADTEAALAMFDLDGFKAVNRAHGRRAGDRVLRDCGERFRLALAGRDGEGVAILRMGGDRFAVLVTGEGARDRVVHHVDAVMDAFVEPFALADRTVRLGCSAGLAAIADGRPDTGSARMTSAEGAGAEGEARGLVARAEAALEDAKLSGRGQWRCFEPAVGERIDRRRRIEADLVHAVERGEMALHFQPLVDLAAGRVTTCEALLRWTHGELGPVPPGEFVPVAERTGAIDAIGAFVLAEACRAAAAWPHGVRVAVNLSPRQFRDRNLAADVARVLAETGLDPSRLEVEVTESAVIDDHAHTREVMDGLRRLGVRTALDDFGTGHSSLSLLGFLPFDKVKLDRAFMTFAETDPAGLVLMRGITRVAGEMGLSVVVEGVETSEQLDRLLAHSHDDDHPRPDEVQGYLFSRPLPEREARALLARMPDAMAATLEGLRVQNPGRSPGRGLEAA